MQVKKQQLEADMEQQTHSKLGKVYVKAIYCHSTYLTYIQSTSMQNAGLDEAQVRIKIPGRNINNLRYADDTTLIAEGEEELKSLLMKVKCVSRPVLSNSLQPHGLYSTRILCPWNFPGKNTGVGCHILLQGIFPIQGLNLGLLHCRQILYCLSHQGSLMKMKEEREKDGLKLSIQKN